MRSTKPDSTPATGPLDLPFYKGERSSEVHQSRISEVQSGPGRSSEGQWSKKSTRLAPAPPSRAAGTVSESASACLGSALLRTVSPATLGTWHGGPAARALGRSAHTGRRVRTSGSLASSHPSSRRLPKLLQRVPGLTPDAPLQAFENSGLAGRVRRCVRLLTGGRGPILGSLAAHVRQRTGPRPRGSHSPAEVA